MKRPLALYTTLCMNHHMQTAMHTSAEMRAQVEEEGWRCGEVDSRRYTPGLISQRLTGDEEKHCFPSQHAAMPQLG